MSESAPLMPKIMVLNGPNLDLLGRREPEIYGRETLADIEAACRAHGAALGLEIDFRQSNGEGALIDMIHEARDAAHAIVINAGAYSHTSMAIMDALIAAEKPVVEVHLSNFFKREPYRHRSYVTGVAEGLICGFGAQGYLLALDAVANILAPE